jgi:hypothetical protein
MGPATQMLVGNDRCLAGSSWEPYASTKVWTLPTGEGWRSVYVKTRDLLSRTVTVNDSIYFGANPPLDQLGATQMSTTQPTVTLYNLNGGGLSQVQFSLGWTADDTFSTFGLLWGSGQQVNDPATWGGTAFRLTYTNTMESSAWVWDTQFIKGTPQVAYVRLKVSDNTSTNEVARFSATNGSTLSLKGTDFSAANQYQEFPVSFTFGISDTFLIFQFWRSGLADVSVDAVSIFTAPQPVASTLTWNVPGGNYRGQGVWVRYTNGSNQFSSISEATTMLPTLTATPTSVVYLVARNGSPPAPAVLNVIQGCQSISWQAHSNAAWLQPQVISNTVQVKVDQTGLSNGVYSDTLTISAVGTPGVPPVSVPVTLTVVDTIYSAYLPLIQR